MNMNEAASVRVIKSVLNKTNPRFSLFVVGGGDGQIQPVQNTSSITSSNRTTINLLFLFNTKWTMKCTIEASSVSSLNSRVALLNENIVCPSFSLQKFRNEIFTVKS